MKNVSGGLPVVCGCEVRGRQWIKGEHGYFAGSVGTGGGGSSGGAKAEKGLDKSDDESYNMFRKTKNTGDFQSLNEPMQMRHIKSIIKDLDIDCKGIEFDIVRDKELIGKNVFGYTFPDGKRIQLYPDAFKSREELVKTIGHERIHCEQIKLFGKSRSMSELIDYEKAAAFSENYWWSEYVRRTGYNENK